MVVRAPEPGCFDTAQPTASSAPPADNSSGAPDAIGIAGALEKLPPDRRRLVEKLLAKQGESSSTTGPIPRSPRRQRARLSFAQQRVWTIEQLAPDTATYCEAQVLHFARNLDAQVLTRVLNEIVRRHAILRTSFRMSGDDPEQVVEDEIHLDLPVIDLTAVASDHQEARLAQVTHEYAQKSFNLEIAPLMRAALIRLAPRRNALFVCMHHLVCDGWSIGVLAFELTALYDAFAAELPSPLSELPLQFADFAEWQRTHYVGKSLDLSTDFWRARLAQVPRLALPTVAARPPVQSYRGERLSFTIPDGLRRQVLSTAAMLGVSSFVVLFSAFAILMGRYGRQEDFAVGTPAAGRSRTELEGLIGFFVTMLAIRIDLSGDPSVRQLLRRAQESVLEAFQHQDVPLERVIEALQLPRDPSRNPLFDVAFQLFAPPSAPGIDPARVPAVAGVSSGSAKFDLRMDIHALATIWSGYVEYATDIFERPFIEGIINQFRTLLAGMLEDPDRTISALPLLLRAEREHLIRLGTSAARRYPAEQTIPRVFEAIAAQYPDAPAVEYGRGALTYRELDRRANALARRLVQLGVGTETSVGLGLASSPDLAVAMLAILKAGGAYVPLDPEYPPERLRFVIKDAGLSLILTDSRWDDDPAFTGIRTLKLSDPDAVSEDPPDRPQAASITPEQVAYITYTSGSTGEPKGVETPHSGVVRLVKHTDYLQLGPGDRVAQASTPMFDAFTFEIWGPLLNGGVVVGIPREDLLSPDALMERLQRDRIEVGFFTTDLFNQIVAARPDAFAGMNTVLFGGTAADVRRVRSLLAARRPRRLLNVYGPTECTTFATWYQIRDLPANASDIPIGRAIANTECYILDDTRAPVPPGMPGELYLGGPGLARGYRNRPDLTAAAFVSHPFDSHSGARLYRTGDIVRCDHAGHIHFLGRRDEQVKIRGFRVEPGEIEAALRRHPDIREAVVIARQDVPGERRLIAYVAGLAEQIQPERIRTFLRVHLPEYMLPAAIVQLDALPLAPNGKVDRTALPVPDPNRRDGGRDYVGPTNTTEDALAKIWSQLLGLKQVGIHDNFFEVGGDSILSLQLIARARDIGITFTAHEFFQNQTIAELARVAQVQNKKAHVPPAVGKAPLLPIQRWFFAQNLPEPHHFNQSVMLWVRDRLDAAAVATAVSALTSQHEAFHCRFRCEDHSWEQEILRDVATSASFEAVDLSAVDTANLAEAIESKAARTQARLNLSDGPLFTTTLFDCGPARPCRLLFTAHHLIVDGVSWRILSDDFWTAYRQAAAGQPISLPPRTSSLKAWAEKITALAQSEEMRREADFWVTIPRKSPPPLPHDVPGSGNLVGTSERVEVALTSEETRNLLHELPRIIRADFATVLLIALARVMLDWTRQDRILMDVEGHGREDLFPDIDLSRTIGWFTAIHPIEIVCNRDADMAGLVRATKETLAQIPRKGIGYGLLRWLGENTAAEQLAARPISEISFNYLGQIGHGGDNAQVRLAEESVGPLRAARGSRAYVIEVDALVNDGLLRTVFTYQTTFHHRSTIERLAANFIEALRTLYRTAQDPALSVATPGDFAKARVTQQDLDKIAARLARKR
jgi:amino acid adenylation domain-containing protein/non-ribosomal peptide synthase protein (TIGR01720 family)